MDLLILITVLLCLIYSLTGPLGIRKCQSIADARRLHFL